MTTMTNRIAGAIGLALLTLLAEPGCARQKQQGEPPRPTSTAEAVGSPGTELEFAL